MQTNDIPLGLYIHIPWCVQKCPYCDFNSHNLKGDIPSKEYVAHLLDDLDADLPSVSYQGDIRSVSSIFIGGGTPSLLPVEDMHTLLEGIKRRIPLKPNAEITMEANPGTVEAHKFKGFHQAGINRISVGVQSFSEKHLSLLGRIHDSQQAFNAVDLAGKIGLSSFNLDLMHGLPQQDLSLALHDLKTAIKLNPPHLSWYQLTIEPNTSFASKPPTLPDDDVLWDIQEQGHALLSAAGYHQYEISGYSKPEHQCQHNLNYWRYGDYLGIGCGAHGKVTDLNTGKIQRTVKVKHPKGYMDLSKPYLNQVNTVDSEDLAFEFFMNRFRLVEACPKADFERLTHSTLSYKDQQTLSKAIQQGLIEESPDTWRVTELGRRYLNSLLDSFV
jgi:oxygen-independent coproporphyrinogen-3 oxidase